MNEKKILSYGLEAKLGTLNPHKYYSYTGTITAQIVRMCGARLYVKLPNEDYTSFVQMGQVAEGNPIQVIKKVKFGESKSVRIINGLMVLSCVLKTFFILSKSYLIQPCKILRLVTLCMGTFPF